MRNFLELAKEPVFIDKGEREFCLVSIERLELSHARSWYIASLVFWLICIGLPFVRPVAETATLFLIASGVFALFLKTGILLLVKRSTLLRRGQLIGYVLSNLIMFAAVHMQKSAGQSTDVLLVIWGLGSVLALGLLAYRNWVHIFAITLFLGLFLFAIQGHHAANIGWVFAALMAIVMSNAQIVSKRFIKLELIKSYRQQSVYTPRQVLLQAIQSKLSLTELFKPESRYSVCICSDWRSFQDYSSTVTPEKLAETLEAYYGLQVKLLDEAFPHGNYFIDWIADELFVVGFVSPECDEQQLLSSAVYFGIRSVKSRPDFCRTYGAPQGLDVGISGGYTTVGMLGPHGNKKATALGQVPGTARRLQTLAKEMRSVAGSRDRVVVAPGLLSAELALKHGLKERVVPSHLVVKDIHFTSVFCFENQEQPLPLAAVV